VWTLVAWNGLQVLTGIVMQSYCLARRARRRMTARYDAEMENTVLLWHFVAFTVAVTVAVIAGFPLVA
jgi:cytochrome c oxidase subunit I+III